VGRPALAFAAIAAIPAMAGPLAAEGRQAAMIALCGGGAIAIPLDRAPAGGEGNSACCAKGCHSSQSRKKAGRTR